MNIDPNADRGFLEQTFGAETGRYSRIAVRSIFPLLVAHSLSLGWCVPAFYDWSGANQGHSPPIVGYAFQGFVIACAVSLLALPILPRLKRVDPVRNPLIQPFGFRIVPIILAVIMAGLIAYQT